MAVVRTSKKWWGARELEPGGAAGLRIGPLSLALERRSREWRIGFASDGDPLDPGVEIGPPRAELDETHRFAATSGDRVILTPATADRPVISRPEDRFHLPAGAAVTVFVGSPLWLKLGLEPPGPVLLDIPIARPPDTWFGPLTVAGELCYASRTVLRLEASEVVWRPHRALTQVEIVNRAEERLDLEHLKLPVQHLSLYTADDGRLWTDPIRLIRREGDEFADVVIERNGRREGWSRVSGPRLPPPKGFVARAFSGLLGIGREES